MKNSKFGFTIIALFLFFGCNAQKKVGLPPYTIATTYEKLSKDYPFITPISPLKSDDFIAEEDVVYRTVNGIDLKADVYYPKAEANSNFPAVLLVHGGGWVAGSKENERVMAQHLAQNGFVAITATYRLSDVAIYPAAVLDLKAAVKWMKTNASRYHINTDKIAVLGASAGAQLATLIGVTPNSSIYSNENDQTSDAVQAIINIDGIVSFTHPDSEEGEIAGLWLGGLQNENPKNWKEASPLEYVNQHTSPLLFINSTMPRFHAGRDDMVAILNQNNIYNEVHTIPGTPHSFWLMHPWFESALQYTVAFLNRVFNAENREIYRKITVAQDGSGDFTKIQEAINSTRDLGPDYVRIFIKNGIYNEKINIPDWKRKIALIGEDRDNTIITFSDYSGKTDPVTKEVLSTFTSSTLKVEGIDFYAENLTIQNTWCEKGQAVALHATGDRSVFKNCKILGCQDTIYSAGEGNRQLFDNCYIEGTTDFIFGQATAFFKDCEIKSLVNSYVTAAATPANQKYGFVFLDCKLTAAAKADKVYLGRPWRPYAKTVFINCDLGNHIVEEGWDLWTGDAMFPNKERTTFYAEFESKGAGANPEKRAKWTHQLDAEEAATYTLKNVLKGSDNWQPLLDLE
ncbi:MAG: pectinesterase family protein [Leeuwenhoekiella sp.]